jgi:hypothetical protein
MIAGYPFLADQPLLKIFRKAGWVRHRQTNVFIQLKQLYFLPVDARQFYKRIQELNLGSASRRDDTH